MIFPSLIRIVENRISRRTRNDDRDNGREKREGGVAGKWKRTERMGDGMFRMTNVAIWYEQRDSLEFKKKKKQKYRYRNSWERWQRFDWKRYSVLFFFFFFSFGVVPRRCGTNIRALPIFRPPNATTVLLSTIHYGLIISYSHMELKRASLSHYLRIARPKMNNLYLSLSLVVFE